MEQTVDTTRLRAEPKATAPGRAAAAHVDIAVGGMTCPHCPSAIEAILRVLDGVLAAHVNLATGRASVDYEPSRVGVSEITRAMRAAEASSGYQEQSPAPGREEEGFMNDSSRIFAAVIAASMAAFGGAQAATVYIAEGSAGDLVMVDAATDAIVGRVEGLPDVHGLGGVAGGRYLVAGSFAEAAPAGVEGVAKPAGVSEDEHAAHHGGAAPPASSPDRTVSILTVIDATDGSPVRRLEVPGAVHHVAVSPDGRHAVATHPGADGVSIVDLSDLSVRGLVRTGPTPNYAAFSPDGTRVYVTNSGNGTVSEIDTGRWFVRRNLLAGESPEHVVVAPDGRALYVVDVDVGAVLELSLDQGDVARRFAVGGEAHGLDLSDDGSTLFVSGKGENKVVAIDLRSGDLRSAALGPAPYHLTVIRGTGKLYVSSREEPKVWVVDQESLALQATIPILGEGHQMVVLP